MSDKVSYIRLADLPQTESFAPLDLFLTGANETSCTLRCQIGVNEKDKPVYAGVKLNKSATTFREALDVLAGMVSKTSEALPVKVSLPPVNGGALKLSLSAVMPSVRVAVLFAFLAGLECPKSISPDRQHAELSACGLKGAALKKVA